jgi:hypothetical protein
VTDVYIDVGATSNSPTSTADPAAVKALRHLAEAGVRIVLVTAGGAEPDADLRAAATEVLEAVPARPPGRSWYLTNDISRCQGSSAHLRTVLIGGTPAGGSVRRCDAVARDLQAAAMEILAADAMPSVVSSPPPP